MKRFTIIILVGLVLAIIVLASSMFVVKEWEQVIITEFGKPVGEPITQAGLHFKKPFIQDAIYLEKRIIPWDGEPKEILTQDKEPIRVNTWARWRIKDPLMFYIRTKTVARAQGVLDEIIQSTLQKVIKTYPLMEVTRNSSRSLEYSTDELKVAEEAKGISIKVGRDKIVQEILEKASEVVVEDATKTLIEQYGIELVDVRIKQINYYVPKTIEAMYGRMRSERLRIRDSYVSEGNKRMEEIEGEIAQEKDRIVSEGYKIAKEIKGQADAGALKIYAEAYGRDPEFYSFIKTLETYEKSFNKDTRLILSTDSEFFKYLIEYMPKEK